MTHLIRPRRATCSCPAAKELSGRSARSLAAGEPAPKVRPAPGGRLGTGGVTRAGGQGAVWPLLFVVSYYSNEGPSKNFSYAP